MVKFIHILVGVDESVGALKLQSVFQTDGVIASTSNDFDTELQRLPVWSDAQKDTFLTDDYRAKIDVQVGELLRTTGSEASLGLVCTLTSSDKLTDLLNAIQLSHEDKFDRSACLPSSIDRVSQIAPLNVDNKALLEMIQENGTIWHSTDAVLRSGW